MQIHILFAVAFGGAVGAVVRYLLSTSIHKLLGGDFAYGTLGVNIVGSLFIGFLFMFFEQTISPLQKALLITGMMGALTTFSTFSLETLLMVQNGMFFKATLNILANVLLSIIATLIGMLIFKKLYGV
jgi:CrcB protein